MVSSISFGENYGPTQAIDLGGGTYEVGAIAVPESSTIYSLLLVLGVVGVREQRRLRTILARRA